MKLLVIQVVFLFAFANISQCAKILGVFHMAAPSHYILGSSLMRALAEKGHDVTMISPFGEKNPPKNGTYRDIILTGFIEEQQEQMKKINMFKIGNANVLFLIPFFANMMQEATEKVFAHPNVQEFLKQDEKFDVVIVEQFMNEAHKGFAAHFDASLIAFSTIGASSWINPLVGNPTTLAYASEPLSAYSSNMTFCERFMNVFLYGVQQLVNHVYTFPQQNKLLKKYISQDLELEDIMYNISLVLLNAHPSINQPVPYVPNMIDIGGFHVKPPKKLPKDLQEFLDNSKEGVIYFSLGSNIKSAQMDESKRDALLKAFAKLKVKVLWKWEEDVLPGKPPNVHLGKWLPQQDILAHPNVKLFITHSGLLSTIETVYHGVPVLAIPIGGDQKLNAARVVNQGLGLKLNYDDLTEEILSQSINELLSNPKYSQNAKMSSKVFHDRIVKPLDTATYWVEYVARHKGATHLRVAAIDLPWYQYFLLDVISVMALIVVSVVFISCFVTKKIFKKLCSKTNKKNKKD